MITNNMHELKYEIIVSEKIMMLMQTGLGWHSDS